MSWAMRGRLRALLLGAWATVSVATVGVGLRLEITRSHAPAPGLIVVLGGEPEREMAAAQLASWHPDLAVWMSSRRPARILYRRFEAEGVSRDRVTIDARATDTLTNFTTLVAHLRQENIHHVYLVTSDYHLVRSRAIAFWILGSHGIWCTPVAVVSNQNAPAHNSLDNKQRQQLWKTPRDTIRSWLWLVFRWHRSGTD